ncbi:uncharacterized protein LOC143694647 [Agelaius phoeniceus]|uniref:uncharacterized protein LOC143694647 n=1 Tax=Agelaius phoeniceus TaxID=39638 RepID=UPI004054BADB
MVLWILYYYCFFVVILFLRNTRKSRWVTENKSAWSEYREKLCCCCIPSSQEAGGLSVSVCNLQFKCMPGANKHTSKEAGSLAVVIQALCALVALPVLRHPKCGPRPEK